MNRTAVKIVAAVMIAVFAVGTLLNGETPKASWLRYYSIAVFVVGALWATWDRCLWRWNLLQRFNFVPPNVRGTWQGELRSEWVNPDTGAKNEPKTAYLVIHQTFSSVRITLLTDESRSESSLARVTRTDYSRSLDYMYINNPDLGVEHRSRSHHGSTSLSVTGAPATRLRGRYWTDRDSKGELDLADRISQFADDHQQAHELFALLATHATSQHE